METLKSLGLEKNTLIIFSSDNGPILDDGYSDKAEELVITEKKTKAGRLIDLMSNIESVVDKKGRHTIILEGHGYRWFRDNSRG